jgi:hypothetical protein
VSSSRSSTSRSAISLSLREPERADDLFVEHAYAARGDRPHRELFLPGNAELTDDEDVERLDAELVVHAADLVHRRGFLESTLLCRDIRDLALQRDHAARRFDADREAIGVAAQRSADGGAGPRDQRVTGAHGFPLG